MKRITLVLTLYFVVFSAIVFGQEPAGSEPAGVSPAMEKKDAGAPGAPVFDYDAAKVNQIASDSRKTLDKKLDEIAKIAEKDRTFENTVLAMENALADFQREVTIPQFMGYVHENSEVRNAASKFEEEAMAYLVEISTRRDLFNAVNEFAQKKIALASDDAFLLQRTLLDFKRNGLALPEKELGEFKDLKKKLVANELKFEKNIRDFKDQIEITKEQLEGLPEDFIGKMKKTDSGKYIVTLDYPDYYPFMDNAKSEEARKEIEFKFSNRCASDNISIMEEALAQRQKLAEMLGYKNHSGYILEDRMAKDPTTVTAFLDSLRLKLVPKAEAELKSRLELKAKETKTPVDPEMRAWNWKYWNNQFRKLNLDIDPDKVKEYFPTEIVIPGMLGIFGEVFGVKFEKAELPVWHKDVTSFKVLDDKGGLIGYFYMDLFPRDGKYKHMACFGLVKGRLMPDGSYRKPSAAIVGNFPKPSKDIPSLMPHNDVETLFHEFGHVLHNLFTTAKYSSFSGTDVSRDFVETPSTLLENWAWNPEVLKRVSGHYKNPTEKIPDALIKKLIDAKNFDSGMAQIRQLFFSKLDIAFHTTELKNTTETYKKMMKEIMFIPLTEGVAPQANFGHLMGGYDSGYYGYLWSRGISSDIFSEFEKNGVFNPAIGKKYRDLILAVGRTPDPNVQIEQFLGRKFNEDAFIKKLGLSK